MHLPNGTHIQARRGRGARRVVRAALALATLAFANACYVWRPVVLDASHDFVNGNVRLHRTDGAAVVVRGPRLVGDSIHATATRTVTPVAFATSDVERIEVRQLSRGRTALAASVLMLAYLAFTWGFSDTSVDTGP